MGLGWEPFITEPEMSAVLVDFDGTIAPIVASPEDALPIESAVTAIRQLSRVLRRVAIVSARPVHFISRHFEDDEHIVFSGHYGLETMTHGRIHVDARVEEYRSAVELAAKHAEELLPGLLIERKTGVSLGIHWRKHPDMAEAAVRIGRELGERHGLVPHLGRMVIELRPPIPLDKGTAVRQLVLGLKHVFYAGDDIGDIAAFSALRDLVRSEAITDALLVAVDSSEGPGDLLAAADYTVSDPGALAAMLVDLTNALRARRSGTAI